jgi:hypothetical protein
VHVFLDASALIYLVEGRPPFAAGVRTAVQALQADQGPLQAACCLQLGPRHVMLTGDAAFGRVPGLNVRAV